MSHLLNGLLDLLQGRKQRLVVRTAAITKTHGTGNKTKEVHELKDVLLPTRVRRRLELHGRVGVKTFGSHWEVHEPNEILHLNAHFVENTHTLHATLLNLISRELKFLILTTPKQTGTPFEPDRTP